MTYMSDELIELVNKGCEDAKINKNRGIKPEAVIKVLEDHYIDTVNDFIVFIVCDVQKTINWTGVGPAILDVFESMAAILEANNKPAEISANVKPYRFNNEDGNAIIYFTNLEKEKWNIQYWSSSEGYFCTLYLTKKEAFKVSVRLIMHGKVLRPWGK